MNSSPALGFPVSQGVSISFPLRNLFVFKLASVVVLLSDSRGHSRPCHRGTGRRRPGGGGRGWAAAGLLGLGQRGSRSRLRVLGLGLQPQSSGPPSERPQPTASCKQTARFLQTSRSVPRPAGRRLAWAARR